MNTHCKIPIQLNPFVAHAILICDFVPFSHSFWRGIEVSCPFLSFCGFVFGSCTYKVVFTFVCVTCTTVETLFRTCEKKWNSLNYAFDEYYAAPFYIKTCLHGLEEAYCIFAKFVIFFHLPHCFCSNDTFACMFQLHYLIFSHANVWNVKMLTFRHSHSTQKKRL